MKTYLLYFVKQMILFSFALLTSMALLMVFIRSAIAPLPFFLALLVILILYSQARRFFFFGDLVRLDVRFSGFLTETGEQDQASGSRLAPLFRQQIRNAFTLVKTRRRSAGWVPLKRMVLVVETAAEIAAAARGGHGSAIPTGPGAQTLWQLMGWRTLAILALFIPFALVSFLLGFQLSGDMRPVLYYLAVLFTLFLVSGVIDPVLVLLMHYRLRDGTGAGG